MKRMLGVLATAFATLVIGAGSALAQTYPPSPDVEGAGGGGGTAFTGSDTSTLAIVVIALLAVGLVALFVARRRSSHVAA
jgi:LPXTG-motif cell wall-anchored protein